MNNDVTGSFLPTATNAPFFIQHYPFCPVRITGREIARDFFRDEIFHDDYLDDGGIEGSEPDLRIYSAPILVRALENRERLRWLGLLDRDPPQLPFVSARALRLRSRTAQRRVTGRHDRWRRRMKREERQRRAA